eukprot:4689399-Amphidinium_carterae.1
MGSHVVFLANEVPPMTTDQMRDHVYQAAMSSPIQSKLLSIPRATPSPMSVTCSIALITFPLVSCKVVPNMEMDLGREATQKTNG